MPKRTIDDYREEIDRIDDRILKLLERRARAAEAIGRMKASDGTRTYVPSREKKILDRLTRERGRLPAKVVRTVFREVISACRGLEEGLRVVYLGPEATFSHMAARRHFGAGVRFAPVGSITQVFEEVEKGRANFGVVPIENSTDGSVTYTLDRFLDSEVRIASETCLDVSHFLLSKTRRRERIRRIVSHPQALAQCRRWLSANFPGIPLDEAPSTGRAAEIASKDSTAAAIASEMAAEVYGLEVLEGNIQDLTFNATRFVVIAAEDSENPSGDDKTSAVVSVRDEVGVLQKLLEPFAENEINLTRIESRPLRGKAWEYVFFLDFLGHRKEPRVARTLERVDPVCRMVRILGSYPVWRERAL